MGSRQEQGLRLMEGLDCPEKRWKHSPGNLATRAKRDEFQQAYADVFRCTATEHAPRSGLPADHT